MKTQKLEIYLPGYILKVIWLFYRFWAALGYQSIT
jgi:hypothetical protein